MKLSSKRAESLSILAMFLQALFFLFSLLIGNYVNSLAVKVEAWHFLGGVLIWFILFLQFRQRRLVEEERFDAEQYDRMRAEGKGASVFDTQTLDDEMHVAERRQKWLEKYLLSIFAILQAIYLLGIGVWQFIVVRAPEIQVMAGEEKILQLLAFLAGLAVVSFMFSWYAIGMSRQAIWRPIRSGGSYLFSNALVNIAIAIVLGIYLWSGRENLDKIAALVLSIVMAVIGIEIILNLLLDAFRPRLKGQYYRAAFESRLLGLFSEPGGMLRTFSHAIDYQFGFKVSDTWFYKLLEKAILPLLAAQALVLYLMTCFVVVPAGHVGVIERWGKPVNLDNPLPNGMHMKFPSPIDKLVAFPVEQVQTLDIGFTRKEIEQKDGRPQLDNTPILWTQEHWKDEFPFILPGISQTGSSVIPVSNNSEMVLIDKLVVAITVQYKIADIERYGYAFSNPDQLLESICYNEATRYCSQSDIESLLGPGRYETSEKLKQAINRRIHDYDMGIDLLSVSLSSVHPPVKIADAFEKVISSLQSKQASILKAQGESAAIIASAEAMATIRNAEADAYKFERVTVAQANSDRFSSQLKAWEQGQGVYLWREYLSVLEETMPELRKYFIAADDVNRWVYELDLKEKLQPDIFTGLGLPEEKQENQQ